jgi:hypothetical protein
LKRGEEVGWPDQLAAKYGRGGVQIVNIHNHNPNFVDRRSTAQVNASQAASIKAANRNL